MSQAGGIPLYSTPDSAGYRLIELPAELVTLLESGDAPILTIEASEPAALLKAGDKTYSLRQKNTSNAVVLLKPFTPPTEDTQLEGGMTAITTIHESVELEPAPQTSGIHEKPIEKPKGKWHERFGRNR